MANELARYNVMPMTLEETMRLGDIFAKSGFFQDVRGAAQAVVKIMAGAELGFPAIASMTGVYIVQNRVTLSANLIGAAIKRSGRYNYRVKKLDDTGCEIEFFENGESVGVSSFGSQDAQKAGLAGKATWKQYPRNMYFARALSNGARWYTPDVFNGPIYTPDELGAEVDGETGEVIDYQAPEPAALPDPQTVETAEPDPGRPNGHAQPSVRERRSRAVSPFQLQKIREMVEELYEGTYDDLGAAVEQLFMEQVGHGPEEATYDEGRRVTAFLLQEKRLCRDGLFPAGRGE